MARRTEPEARVLVFIDGQNTYKACERLYRHGRSHPLLVAERVCDGRTLVGVRYYSGVHDPTINPDARRKSDRRHHLIRRTGVTVVERKLRYRWEWGFDPSTLPDAETSKGTDIGITVRPYQRAREKGIDLAIGLDVVDLALGDYMDVAVIVSSDNDLCEAVRATHAATTGAGKRVSVEAALFSKGKNLVVLQHYDWTRQLKFEDFEATRDSFDYTNPLAEKLEELFIQSCVPIRAAFP